MALSKLAKTVIPARGSRRVVAILIPANLRLVLFVIPRAVLAAPTTARLRLRHGSVDRPKTRSVTSPKGVQGIHRHVQPIPLREMASLIFAIIEACVLTFDAGQSCGSDNLQCASGICTSLASTFGLVIVLV
jgi:hypothetical protein